MKMTGDKLPPKHCYSNPLDYNLCIFTSMDVCFIILKPTWSNENQYMMFIKPRSIYGFAPSRYTGCIKNWVTTYFDHIDNFIGPNHMNAYSNRKVGGTYDYSVTTSPSPLSSIFHLGEW